jgi:hypothetical protein
VAYVNEAFGVYNRNAVVREDLAEYDAAIEEAYNCMKEDDDDDDLKGPKVTINGKDMGRLRDTRSAEDQATVDKARDSVRSMVGGSGGGSSSSSSLKGVDSYSRVGKFQESAKLADKCMKEGEKKDEKKEDKPKADYSKMREKMVGKGKDLETTRKIVGEAKKLADKDEVWGSRFRAAKMAGKMEEEQINELKAPTAKTAHAAYDRAERSDDIEGDWKRSNRLYSYLKKKYPGKSGRNQKPTGKADLPSVSNTEFHKDGYSGHVTKKGKLTKSATKDTKADIKSRLGRHTKPNLPEEAQIDEATGLKKVVHTLFGKQIAKHRANKADSEMERTLNTRGSEKKWAKNYDARERYGRIAAGKPPFKDMDEETQIDEIKVSTAYSYAGKKMEKERKGLLPGDHNPTSKTELKNMKNAAERTDKDYYKKRGFKKVEEALKGNQHRIDVNKNNKIDSQDFKLLRARKNMKEEQVDEAAYSAKAARAGKDIGKPGKMFKKIASKAGEKYGSEERGKKVAGAILKRIRAKHMREADVTSNYSGSKLSDTGHSGTYHGDVSYKSSAERMKSGSDYVDPHRTEIKNDKNLPGL